jgi:hypothetical protein
MGQPITVVEKPSSNPAVIRFETNRPLSGMAHERYREPPSELLDRPADELARRLFAAGGIEAVHVNGNVVTVSLDRGRTAAGLADVVRSLFRHYPDQPSTAGGAGAEAAETARADALADAVDPAAPPPDTEPGGGTRDTGAQEMPSAGTAADDTDTDTDAGTDGEEPGEAGFGRDADGEAQPDEPRASEGVIPDPEPAADQGASTEEPPAR